MSPEWIVVLLGLIEGLTEFIPVSSTGHLLLAQHWLGARDELFNAVIQCGAMAAALPLFSSRLATLKNWREPETRDYFLKLLLAFFITGVGGLVLKKLNYRLPKEIMPVAMALIIGGVLFLLVESLIRGKQMGNRVTWTIAIAVGIAQLVAIVFPGASRSGCTILIALLLGLERRTATEFSFLVGIPTLFAAGAKESYDVLKAHTQVDWQPIWIGSAVAAVVSFLAVKWMLNYLRHHTFVAFGVYRMVVGSIMLYLA